MSLQLVLGTVCTLCLIAAAMVALFTANLNLTVGFANGNIAQDEAEAGVSQAMAELTADPAYGTHDEEIVSTSSNLDPRQAGHVVTFKTNGEWPWSTNNQASETRGGYAGRTVPGGMTHLISTGFCRGQVRTVEAIVCQPPFPYAVAASGTFRSKGSLIIEGAQSSGGYVNGSTDRPGDLAANSPRGVVITPSGGSQTYISGFVKSRGPIRIDPPRIVRAGIFASSGTVALPQLEVTSYDNHAEKGVIALGEPTYGATTLSGAYYAGGNLTYSGALTLSNAFLYVRGNLTLSNGVTGTGALVVDGSITMKGGPSQIVGSQSIALVATGPIAVAGTGSGRSVPGLGSGNVFEGLVYSQTAVDARNILVVGNVVVDAPKEKPDSGGATFENVHVVGTRDASSIKFTVTLAPDSQPTPEPVTVNNVAVGELYSDRNTFKEYIPPRDDRGNPLPPDMTGQKLYLGTIPGTERNREFRDASEETAKNAKDVSTPSEPSTDGSTSNLPIPKSWQALLTPMPAGSIEFGDLGIKTSTPQGKDIADAVEALQKAQTAAVNPNASPDERKRFEEAKQELAYLLSGGRRKSSASNGNDSSSDQTDATHKTYDFSLNTFLPSSGRLRITFWRMVNHRI
ncbi:MAG: hypothetical protein EB084_04820 [Proteobacteria bacterium]|nr:hypothetical protein [Pseudomonadota bacterium]